MSPWFKLFLVLIVFPIFSYIMLKGLVSYQSDTNLFTEEAVLITKPGDHKQIAEKANDGKKKKANTSDDSKARKSFKEWHYSVCRVQHRGNCK